MASASDDAMRSQSPDDVDSAPHGGAAPDNASIPKPKRLACMICRKRKLKCDGLRPSCSTCSRLGHSCAYDEQRRKSGPKRGYVKALEERLKQVETLLKTQDAPAGSNPPNTARNPPPSMLSMATGNPQTNNGGINVTSNGLGLGNELDMDGWQVNGDSPQPGNEFNFNSMPLPMNSVTGDFTWEMIGLGLEEPLPAQETIDEMHQIYFEKVHPSIPMIHKYRYLAAMNLAPAQRPPVCLRYAMWTMACVITDKFSDLRDLFYQRARKYLETDYMKGFGEHMISVAHCQTHILLCSYEMRSMYFPRAWISTGSAVRLAQMIGLHRLDGAGLDVKQCLPPPKDWTEGEERRRTFWMAFAQDRYASIGTGWPMTIDERDVLTQLPASEEAFDLSRPEKVGTLADALAPSGAAKISSFGSIVLMACLFGRNLTHLHRPDADDLNNDLGGPFWKRHRQMDNILLNTSLCLPSHLKLPSGIGNPNVVFANMCIHTSAICLHQAAIFKAEKHKLPSSVSADSKVRCITAANEIASIMRNVSHMDLSALNPFICFCLYVAARVFVQYLKSRPDDSPTADSLRFLLLAMNTLKRRNPLTESFLVQLDIDFEALMARNPELRAAFARPGDGPDGLNILGRVAPAGAVCDDPDAVKGILSYRNECNFLKVVGDSGDLADKSLVDGASNTEESNMDPGPNYVNGHWLDADHRIQQTLTPRSGMGNAGNGLRFGGGNGDGRDATGSSDDGLTSGLTPNSSSATGSNRLQPGSQMNQSGTSSFGASPNMTSMDASGATGPATSTGGDPFFVGMPGHGGNNNGFTMQTGLGLQDTTRVGNYGTIGGNWQEMAQDPQDQTTDASVGDGSMGAFMNIGPLDAMNMSVPWTDGTSEMR